MNEGPLISLCMPTNGVSEWVFPVLDSIYRQGKDEALFEVVITDNGKNDEFKKKIKEYAFFHHNIVYAETEALPFINEIEAYKRANGELIKFINHRTKMVNGAMDRIVNFAKANCKEKPIVYFANGVLNKKHDVFIYDTFDLFVKNLSYWSSWSTGMTIWREDFKRLPRDLSEYNELFPHTDILFHERTRGSYVIDNSVIFDEIPQGKKPKGDYDLYYAFGIEYPWILCNLYREKSISIQTYKTVIDDNLDFLANLYICYNIRKEYCSYDLLGLERVFGVFYSKSRFKTRVCIKYLRKTISKMKGNLRHA